METAREASGEPLGEPLGEPFGAAAVPLLLPFNSALCSFGYLYGAQRTPFRQGAPVFRPPPGRTGQHRPRSGRNSHRYPRRSAGTARSAGLQTGIARERETGPDDAAPCRRDCRTLSQHWMARRLAASSYGAGVGAPTPRCLRDRISQFVSRYPRTTSHTVSEIPRAPQISRISRLIPSNLTSTTSFTL